jgi:hypothetical protein
MIFSPARDRVAIRHPSQIPRPVRRSFSEDGSGMLARNDSFLEVPHSLDRRGFLQVDQSSLRTR